jgi:hypothetical protein
MNIEVEAIQSANYVGSDGTNNPTLSNLSNTLNTKYATELLPTDENYFTLDSNGILTLKGIQISQLSPSKCCYSK